MSYVQEKEEFSHDIHKSFGFLFSQYDFKVDSIEAEQAHGDGTPCIRLFCSSHSKDCEIRFLFEAAFGVCVRNLKTIKSNEWFELGLLLSTIENKKYGSFESPKKYDRAYTIQFYAKLFEEKAMTIFDAIRHEDKLIEKYADIEKQRRASFFGKIKQLIQI